MATTVSSIAFSGPAASLRASELSNQSRIESSSSFVVAIQPLKSLSLRGGSTRAGESVKHIEVLPSGEWPVNFSMLKYENLSKHYEDELFKPEAQPSSHLTDVMAKTIVTASPEQIF